MAPWIAADDLSIPAGVDKAFRDIHATEPHGSNGMRSQGHSWQGRAEGPDDARSGVVTVIPSKVENRCLEGRATRWPSCGRSGAVRSSEGPLYADTDYSAAGVRERATVAGRTPMMSR
jgi:hypothetical protein